MSPFDFRKVGNLLERGIVSEFAPTILKGALIELFQAKKLNVETITRYVQEDVSLWGSIEPRYQQQVKRQAGRLGRIDWFTAGWLVESLRGDMPGVCSLFLGWEEAMTWLEKQILEIKGNLK